MDETQSPSPVPPPHKTFPDNVASGRALDSTAEAYKAAGNKFFRMQAYDQAIEEYSKAVEADPQNSTYLSNRSAALMSAHRYIDALRDARLACETDSRNNKTLLRLARIHTALGEPIEALDKLERIQPPVTEKDRAPALAMLEHVQHAEKILADGSGASIILHAIDQAEKGLGRGVKVRRWQLIRAEAYLRMGNAKAMGDALNIATALLRESSQDPDALVLRGKVLYAQGENDKAIQHFRQALGLDPDFKKAVACLRLVQKLEKLKESGNANFKAGRWKEAVIVYGEALNIDPLNKSTNSRILQNRALAALKLKDYASALGDCEKALELDPSYTKARKTRARALGECGKWEEAVREYKAIAESNPSEPNIAKDVRWAELELKKSRRKDFYKILGIEKDASDQDIKKAYRRLAIVHHPDKNPDSAEADEKFKEIGEAYEILSDPQKRARFDSGEDLADPAEMFSGASPFGGAGMQINPEVLFNMMGSGGGATFSFGGGPFGARGQRQGGFPSGFSF